LIRDVTRVGEAALGAEFGEIAHDLELVLGGDAARGRVRVAELGRCVDEHAAREIFGVEPVFVEIEDREQAATRGFGLGLHELHHAVAEDLVAAAKSGHDELVLGLEMVVDGHAANAASPEDALEPAGVEAVGAEDFHRGFDQFVAAAGGH